MEHQHLEALRSLWGDLEILQKTGKAEVLGQGSHEMEKLDDAVSPRLNSPLVLAHHDDYRRRRELLNK